LSPRLGSLGKGMVRLPRPEGSVIVGNLLAMCVVECRC
jgi:hypothetical protein